MKTECQAVVFTILTFVMLCSCVHSGAAESSWVLGPVYGSSFHTEQDITYRMAFLRKEALRSVEFHTGTLGLGLEAIAGVVELENRDGFEAGVTPLVTYQREVGRWTRVHLDAGFGFLYTDVDVPEFGSDFNFTPQVGLGIRWAVGSSASFDVSYRLRHASNGGIAQPNGGVDAHFLLAGVSF